MKTSSPFLCIETLRRLSPGLLGGLLLAIGLAASSVRPCLASSASPWLSLEDVLPKQTVRVERLGNGLEVVLAPMRAVPIVALQTWVHSGSSEDPEGRSGMATLLERLMFRGTPRFPAREIFTRLGGKGAKLDSQTTRDYTLFEEEFSPAILDEVLDVESDRLANVRDGLNEENLALMRMLAIEEHGNRLQSEPTAKIDEALWAMAFRRHPYRLPVLGVPEELYSITLDEVRAAFERNYSPANVTLVLAGDIDPDAVLAKIRKFYGSIQDRSKREKRATRTEPPGTEERRWTLRTDVVSPRLALGYPITSAADPQTAALDVASNLLFEGEASAMHRRLVGDSGIALGVSGLAFTPREPGLLWTRVALKPGVSPESAEREVDAVLRDLSRTPPSELAVSAAVRQLTLEWLTTVRTPAGLARMLGSSAVMFGDPLKYRQDLERYVRVRPEQVSEVLRKFLDPNQRSVVWLLPEETEKAASPSKKSPQGGVKK